MRNGLSRNVSIQTDEALRKSGDRLAEWIFCPGRANAPSCCDGAFLFNVVTLKSTLIMNGERSDLRNSGKSG